MGGGEHPIKAVAKGVPVLGGISTRELLGHLLRWFDHCGGPSFCKLDLLPVHALASQQGSQPPQFPCCNPFFSAPLIGMPGNSVIRQGNNSWNFRPQS